MNNACQSPLCEMNGFLASLAGGRVCLLTGADVFVRARLGEEKA